MMISALNFQFNLAQLALTFLGGLNLVLGAKARLAPRRTATQCYSRYCYYFRYYYRYY